MKKAIIDRIEYSKAVLVFEDLEKLTVDTTDLPADAREGDAIVLQIRKTDGNDEESLAKNLLNEILSNGA